MTPLAMKTLRHTMRLPNKWVANAIAAAPSFDLTEVAPLISRTSEEIVGTTTEARSDAPLMEHGGLLFTPSEFTWLESRGQDGRRAGVLLHAIEDQIAYSAFSATCEVIIQGFLEIKPDGEHFSVHLDQRWHDMSAKANRASAQVGGWSAAALLLINAPRGVERSTASPHKGLAREARRVLGVGALQPVHTIRLSVTPGDVGEPSGATGGSPKAFHFCRSHLRRLPRGGSTRVRAHWRGDPSLGVGDADYRIVAQRDPAKPQPMRGAA